MKISASRHAQKSIFAHPSKSWKKLLKKASDSAITQSVEEILISQKPPHAREWKFAGLALNELSIRLWGKQHKRELNDLRKKVMVYSQKCVSDTNYSLETAGIIDSVTNRIFHPYAYSEEAKAILDKWYRSSVSKSFEEFLTDGAKKVLKQQSITYLTAKEREAYRVTFETDHIKIGDSIPPDGRYMFVLGGNKTALFAGKKEKGRFHHTSFFKGAPVLCAGQIIVKDGKIDYARLKSGHYKPTPEHGEIFRKFLQQEENLGYEKASYLTILPHDN